jgi:uncharacterized membrane protein YozB (DUF420 family)
MIDPHNLPAVNATLNSISTVLLVTGFVFIRRKNVPAHKACMLSAFACSVLFLATYLAHKFLVGPTRFEGQGAIRTVYLAILLTHTILAAAVPFLAVTTLYRAFKGQFEKHRRIARITFPIWIYVSITGVIVYWMLYRMDFPG